MFLASNASNQPAKSEIEGIPSALTQPIFFRMASLGVRGGLQAINVHERLALVYPLPAAKLTKLQELEVLRCIAGREPFLSLHSQIKK